MVERLSLERISLAGDRLAFMGEGDEGWCVRPSIVGSGRACYRSIK